MTSWFLSGSKCFKSCKKKEKKNGTGLNHFGPVKNISRQGKKVERKML